ncbi:MAG TPA: aminopeptidase P N-terminal domain-containing protein [Terriglobales bacterium]|nr:aminopeptidase P N-terminal domain-containing protein [Terriglobales bacterium]
MFRTACLVILILGAIANSTAADQATLRDRRQRAATAFHDGILVVHANSHMEIAADGFRQDAYFYYLTGQENVVSALLAVDGKSGESWLFLPSQPPFAQYGLKAPLLPGADAVRQSGIEHVVDWTELESFLAIRATSPTLLYYAKDGLASFGEMPANLLSPKAPDAPLWLQPILAKWPVFAAKDVSDSLTNLMAVQDTDEVASIRSVAKSTVAAITAGMRAIHPGVSQRAVESAVESACWAAGAHGSNFWPWVMSGENAVFPKPLASLAAYDHLDREMRSGELVRLDVGCEYQHYLGDLGRTVPVSGHYTDDQRETWNIFVAAYRKAVEQLRAGVKVNDVYEAWSQELFSHRSTAKSALAQHAIDSWSKRENVPFWQIHTSNVLAGWPPDPLPAGVTINFEPIASVDGQGYFLEDMYIIRKDGAELLTPGVPYTAEEIEATMR